MQKYLTEELTEINDNPELIKQKIGDSAFTVLFKHAFNPEFKFLLPEGEPPFKKDAAPIGMSYAILRQELRTFYVFCRADLTPVKREALFIQLLENIHPTEAALLVAIKDQELSKLYPNITHQMAFDNGFVTNPPPAKAPKQSTKKSTGVA
jgi:hypothetical protein